MSAVDELMTVARVVASLLVVLVVVAVTARLARRAGLRGPGAGLVVLDRAGLSREASVAVVRVGGQALLLGVTSHSVTRLADLDPERLEPESLPVESAPSGAPSAGASAVRVVRTDGTGVGAGAGAALAPGRRPGSGSVLSPRTWRQAIEALRDLTARRR